MCVSGILICLLLFGVNMSYLQHVYQYVSQDRLHCALTTCDPLKSKCLTLAGDTVTQKPKPVVLPASSDITGPTRHFRVRGCKKRCNANHSDDQVSFEPLCQGHYDVKGGWEVLQCISKERKSRCSKHTCHSHSQQWMLQHQHWSTEQRTPRECKCDFLG